MEPIDYRIKTPPNVLIIIVTWNKKEYVLNLLNSLQGLNYPQGFMDILVVDNASCDGSIEAISSGYSKVKLLCNPENLGGTGGFNTGLKWAFEQPEGRYDYFWLLDNDVLVHKDALMELVKLLEDQKSAGVAGSTMMQLDYPWRINEMGAFLNRANGRLELNRHLEEIPILKGKPATDIIAMDVEKLFAGFNGDPFMAVEYVAAASLLIRSGVAKEAGLWMDFFIHYDDVEWCLRIAKMGKKILVCARSVIWHLYAVAKVPSWILYYDSRNLLYLMKAHGASPGKIERMVNYILIKAIYYALIGKHEISRLHTTAVRDFKTGKLGKMQAVFPVTYTKNADIESVFRDPSVKRILIPWTIALRNCSFLEPLGKAVRERKDLQVVFLTKPGGKIPYPFPGAIVHCMPSFSFLRYVAFLRLRKKFDLVLQSEYKSIIPISWLGSAILFVNDNEHYRIPALSLPKTAGIIFDIVRLWLTQKTKSYREKIIKTYPF